MQGELIGLIAAAVAVFLVIGATAYNDSKKPEAEEGAEEGAEEEEGAGRGSTGYDADSERSSIISNISADDPYALRGGSRRHRKSNKGSKGSKGRKASKGRKSRKHNNKKSKSKNSKSF
jgi:hypothetical protein